MANVTSAIKARSLSAPLDGGRNPPKPPPQQSIMDIMKRQRLKGEAKDKTIEGLWYDEIDIDEAFDLLRKFRKMHMFFDDWPNQIINLVVQRPCRIMTMYEIVKRMILLVLQKYLLN